MTLANLPPLVTVFGGSGFVGRHVVRALAKRGYRIRVAVRRPDLAGFLQPLGNVGQISFVQANLRYRNSIDRAVEGASHVINCVGILHQTGRNTFDAVQEFGGRAVAEAARNAGATLTHISAIGAHADSDSGYGRTKGRAEAAILSIKPDAVIFRPSIVFGPEDSFFNKFADMARMSPVLPLVGGGKTKFQPVYVEDVAEAVARAVDGKVAGGKIYELGGPEVLSFRECLEMMLKVTSRKNPLVSLPFGLASLIGSIASLIPFVTPPITPDQVRLLKRDNVVSPEAEAEGRTLKGLGITPTMPASVLGSYLVQYRPHGQYTGSGKAA
ncbi:MULTISPECIES: complex I NDUFA9 subunit family protein [Rhizobium]|uniref:complex I NDUFA9 subunit family protein n=1 Tax=Rhizobium TaxID=379 RepID=UPI0007EC023B|nr:MULTISPECIES: complex I NDUFA9 subunit family protein [Rhizobium]ANK89872.1 NAD-dependent nucleoside-diphosphate-sugar epimerase protein [Rhizobium sp. N6212]ANK95899.1 NAD-dependent nucleoside-diphosphate-sugar epimerase protein [Rhizobium sp. N621]ANL01927.1 NAD-dependent nucleoside-diphosphate-sugar epimerase protein [Rhizobium esperanzae]ANL08055.1 NAD-dependent nucleoside-diphosphate-sugar epimerase protein [Rhizobium sp. N1341]ANL20101.1 NAD-dependent nucleoside-diphosphate-sugar epim